MLSHKSQIPFSLIDFSLVSFVISLSKASHNLDFSKLDNNKFFYDVIYNPKETDFLKTGKNLGNKVENGAMMFIYQAHQSFTLWHKLMPEINDEVIKVVTND